jgi:WD40 repeat protein
LEDLGDVMESLQGISGSSNGLVQENPVENFSCKLFQCHSEMVNGLQLFTMRDRQFALSWSDDSTLAYLDLGSNQGYRLVGHMNSVTAAEFFYLKGEPHVASLSYDNTCRLWNLEKQTHVELYKLDSAWMCRMSLFFINNEPRILDRSPARTTIRVWNPENRQSIVLQGHTDAVEGADVFTLNEKKHVLGWGRDGLICVWNVETSELVVRIEAHSSKVAGARFYSLEGGSGLILSWGTDGKIHMWDAGSGTGLGSFPGHPRGERDAQLFALDGKCYLLSYASRQNLRVWNMTDEEPIARFGHSLAVNDAMTVTVNGETQIMTCSWDKTICLWNPENGDLLHTFEGHMERVLGVKVVKTGNRQIMLSWSVDCTARLWDLENHTPLYVLTGHTKTVLGADLLTLSGKPHLITWSGDGSVILTQLPIESGVQV